MYLNTKSKYQTIVNHGIIHYLLGVNIKNKGYFFTIENNYKPCRNFDILRPNKKERRQEEETTVEHYQLTPVLTLQLVVPPAEQDDHLGC